MRGTIDRKFVLAFAKPFGIIKTPLAAQAKELRVSPAGLLNKIAEYKRKGIIRRYGGILAHRKVGFQGNALAAWKVPPSRIKAVGLLLAQDPAVSHCYLRKTYAQWPYNLYTMVHARNRRACMRAIRSLARAAGIRDYVILETVKELKKTKAVIWQR